MELTKGMLVFELRPHVRELGVKLVSEERMVFFTN